MNVGREKAVLDLLRDLRGLDPLKQLVWTELNYRRVNQPISRRNWPAPASTALADDPLLFASGAGDGAFHVIYLRLAADRLLLTQERPVVAQLLRDHPYSLFVFSNAPRDRWHFVNVKQADDPQKRRLFRRITVGPEERLRTASERLTMLDLESVPGGAAAAAPLAIQDRHDQAFDVEAVTGQFFAEYHALFKIVQDDLERQTKERRWSHDFALQFLNRCMFLYFIQRKRWLGDDTEFLRSFWHAYRDARQPADSFFDRWLSVLFFEAFNSKFHGGHRQFPGPILAALQSAPFLNGGLFTKNALDEHGGFVLGDDRFAQVFTFLERYNFTIAEDSPLDQEVAVDPEMIGKVYESLVNVSETADERGDAGIFYTPRTEIDLMCRLALVDNLANHVGSEHKGLLYQLVFALEPGEKVDADAAVGRASHWAAIDDYIRQIAVLDPACGSGSFLVGMLHILDDLQDRANTQLHRAESAYDRKKRIIGQSLYGVDVMDWACHVAELRLWLALIIDAEFTREELSIRREPLLPHFSFKIRSGDSLVQEVGGVNLGQMRGARDLTPDLKRRLADLKVEKLKFYNNDPECRFRDARAVEQEEVRLFRMILDGRKTTIDTQIKALRAKIEGPKVRQMRLDGSAEPQTRQLELTAAEWQKQIDSLVEELRHVEEARTALRSARDVPFVWDIAFVEVFEEERGGFDIVIGNPPYVRQEFISDPRQRREDVTPQSRKQYRAKLAQSVHQTFPRFFAYTPRTGKAQREISAKSDLYIYFYFHGLSLTNQQGSFCFITSNSWLDVGYGANLQEFLLRHAHIKLVIDNQAVRSFATADVNTVIALFGPPDDRIDKSAVNAARFVMLKVPFEQALSSILFDEIEGTLRERRTPEYRVLVVPQNELLQQGSISDVPDEEPDETSPTKSLIQQAEYSGGKWGGRYLRAPDIFFTILKKGEHNAKLLHDVFDGERYLNTGGADGFFIVTEAHPAGRHSYQVTNTNTTTEPSKPFEGEIERRYLVPLIKDFTKSDKRIEVRGHDAYCIVVNDEPSAALRRYIKWGEAQGYHQRSVTRNQRPWYKPTRQMLSGAPILVPRSFNDSFAMFYNPSGFLSLRFYRLRPRDGDEVALVAFLNSTLIALFLETLGNKSLGQGVLDFFMADFLALRVPVIQNRELKTAFRQIKDRAVLPVWEEYGVMNSSRRPRPPTDRKALDDVVFDALGLTQGERDAVYEAVVELVNLRLSKAASLTPKTRRQRLEAVRKTGGIWASGATEIGDAESEE